MEALKSDRISVSFNGIMKQAIALRQFITIANLLEAEVKSRQNDLGRLGSIVEAAQHLSRAQKFEQPWTDKDTQLFELAVTKSLRMVTDRESQAARQLRTFLSEFMAVVATCRKECHDAVAKQCCDMVSHERVLGSGEAGADRIGTIHKRFELLRVKQMLEKFGKCEALEKHDGVVAAMELLEDIKAYSTICVSLLAIERNFQNKTTESMHCMHKAFAPNRRVGVGAIFESRSH